MRDPADAKVKTYCEACGGEIYENEMVYIVNGLIIHDDLDCLKDIANPEWLSVEEALGEE